MYYVYILKSRTYLRHYIGYTDNLDKRIKEHNNGKVRSTKGYRPWNLVRCEIFDNKTEARKRELEIKSYKGGIAFKNLIKDGYKAEGCQSG